MSLFVLGLIVGLVVFMCGVGLRNWWAILIAVVILTVTIFGELLLDPNAARSDQQSAHVARYVAHPRVELQPCVRSARDCHN